MQGKSSEIADLGPGVVKRRSVSFAGSIDDCDFREYDLLKFAKLTESIMKDFKNDSDTTLARFGRDKRARISSAERIERPPLLQLLAADSEHSSDSRPRASYNPNFTSDNRPVREDRAHRDDSRRSGNRSFGSDDRRRNDAADREFKPRFSERKDGYASRPYEDNKPGGFRKFGNPYGEQKEGRDRSFGDRKSGGYSRSDKPYGERRYDDRKQDGYKTFDKPYGERRSDDRKSGGFRGGDRSFGRRDDKPNFPKLSQIQSQ